MSSFTQSDPASALFGFSVGAAGDVNGDGYADLVVGAPKYADGESNEGQVQIYYLTKETAYHWRLRLRYHQGSMPFQQYAVERHRRDRIHVRQRQPAGRSDPLHSDHQVPLQWRRDAGSGRSGGPWCDDLHGRLCRRGALFRSIRLLLIQRAALFSRLLFFIVNAASSLMAESWAFLLSKTPVISIANVTPCPSDFLRIARVCFSVFSVSRYTCCWLLMVSYSFALPGLGIAYHKQPFLLDRAGISLVRSVR